ncbi:D-alanyl-D-alanine carboxypeptidase family protein [Nesterenkonia sp. AY15]|uniref:M15 family metallopeptidase n=1 Tax=Nesterenkonia sp. AY15 TaxID=2901139 RepID=UPI001F4CA738|nr:M15 family metallopeptidase [Nesterenkonia sp. AY15]MCH8570611.1 D-alanyl-D-alanine carboxypeptidase family protein [Nesterenkonia sp. AY15]
MPEAQLTPDGRRQWPEQQARRARVYRRRRVLVAALTVGALLLAGYFLPRAWDAVHAGLTGDQTLSEVRGDQLPEAEDPAPGAESSAEPDSGAEADAEPSPEPTPVRASDPSWDPDSIHVLVNPQNSLDPEDHAPSDLEAPDVRMTTENQLLLRRPAAEALAQLIDAAAQDGQVLAMTSGYRSYAAQLELYANRHSAVGTEETDELVARPGYSEHQTGLAADVISIDNPDCIQGHCFADTPEGQWVAEHAADHGFVIRYPEGAEEITGYEFEPWHLRYVGQDTAGEVAAQGLTLEEYWDQPAAAEYDVAEPDLSAP